VIGGLTGLVRRRALAEMGPDSLPTPELTYSSSQSALLA
jgi:hypothetical protein